MRISLKHQRESVLIRAVKVAVFPGDGRGVALQTQTWEEVM